MDTPSSEPQPVEVPESPPSPPVSLGNAVDLTLGEGGSGREDKRFEYN